MTALIGFGLGLLCGLFLGWLSQALLQAKLDVIERERKLARGFRRE